MASPTDTRRLDSDSDDDDDYVPPENDVSDADSDAEPNPIPAEASVPTEKNKAKNPEIEALWSTFNAPANATPVPLASSNARVRTVKVEKKYLFAGQEVREVVEVSEDSPDAKKWPLWLGDAASNSSVPKTQPQPLESENHTQSASAPSPTTVASTSSPRPTVKGQRPAQRKSKTTLPSIPPSVGIKPKRLTTLDKSAMDWRAHVQSGQELGLSDELAANRRGGGFLEKVEFLQRVGTRKEDRLQEAKGAKRRKL